MQIFTKFYPVFLALAFVAPGLAFIEFVANECGYTYNVLNARQERSR